MHETSNFLLYNNLFIYQVVLYTLIYRTGSLYFFLLNDENLILVKTRSFASMSNDVFVAEFLINQYAP